MVRIAGLEPKYTGFSVLLIVAFVCGCTPTVNHKNYSIYNVILAKKGNLESKNVCAFVRKLQVCADTVRKINRSKSVRNLCVTIWCFLTKKTEPTRTGDEMRNGRSRLIESVQRRLAPARGCVKTHFSTIEPASSFEQKVSYLKLIVTDFLTIVFTQPRDWLGIGSRLINQTLLSRTEMNRIIASSTRIMPMTLKTTRTLNLKLCGGDLENQSCGNCTPAPVKISCTKYGPTKPMTKPRINSVSAVFIATMPNEKS